MNKNLLIAIVMIGTATGCARLSNFLAKPQTQTQAVTVPAHLTNVLQSVPQPAQVTVVTQQVAGQAFYVTNTVQLPPIILTNTVLVPAKIVTNEVIVGYEANPGALAAIERAKALNSSLNPTPTAPIINLILGGLATGLGIFAKLKDRKVKELEPKADALQTVIKAVETFKEGPPGATDSLQAQLKEHIASTANLDQTGVVLAKEVKAVTNG